VTDQERLGDGLGTALGAGLDDIVDLTTYHTEMANLGGFMDVNAEHLTGEAPPAWTAVGVPALALPGQQFGVKVVALSRP
jgi:enamine deaminase RidA (YjgF/YER057c/UK114 family)